MNPAPSKNSENKKINYGKKVDINRKEGAG